MYHESRMGGGIRTYNPRQYTLHSDGLLTIKVTGYEEDETHWTGWQTLSPAEPDYEFWYWMASVVRPEGVVIEDDLGKWKAEFAASCSDLALTVG